MATTSPDGQVRVQLDIARALEQIGDETAMRGMLPMLQELLERDVPKTRSCWPATMCAVPTPCCTHLKAAYPFFAYRRCANIWPWWST
jgi:hypothetical protein